MFAILGTKFDKRSNKMKQSRTLLKKYRAPTIWVDLQRKKPPMKENVIDSTNRGERAVKLKMAIKQQTDVLNVYAFMNDLSILLWNLILLNVM